MAAGLSIPGELEMWWERESGHGGETILPVLGFPVPVILIGSVVATTDMSYKSSNLKLYYKFKAL